MWNEQFIDDMRKMLNASWNWNNNDVPEETENLFIQNQLVNSCATLFGAWCIIAAYNAFVTFLEKHVNI